MIGQVGDDHLNGPKKRPMSHVPTGWKSIPEFRGNIEVILRDNNG